MLRQKFYRNGAGADKLNPSAPVGPGVRRPGGAKRSGDGRGRPDPRAAVVRGPGLCYTIPKHPVPLTFARVFE